MRLGLVLFGIVAAALAAGGTRLAYIQYKQGDVFHDWAKRQQTAVFPLPAERGQIFDARGRVLAGTTRRPSIYVDPSRVEDPRFAAYSVGPVLGLDPAALERLLREKSDKGFVWVKRGVNEDELQEFQAIRKARRLNAFVVVQEARRVYPYGRLAAHILGFIGGEQHGLAGIEQEFDSVLLGTDGERFSTVDSQRRRLLSRPEDFQPPRDGGSIVLTIDAYLQQRTELHLRNAVDTYKAEWGVAVLMDPQSGEVLAMATVPDFDPAHPVPEGPNEEEQTAFREHLRNRAVSDSYEPGSMFKVFIASAAMGDNLTRLDETFVINGPARQFGSRTINDTHAHATLTLEGVISQSSNIAMAMLGDRLGNERLYRYVRSFGFGDLTGVLLPGEHPGLVQDFSRWTSFSRNSIPIGQEIAITPVQLAAAFCAIANDGVLQRPRIVRGVLGANGEPLADYSKPVALRRVLDAEVARAFRQRALVQVVASGSGRQAKLTDYEVFGKTGTAQIAKPNGRGYIPGKYVGSFIGGAPSDVPRVVALVSLYKPSAKGYYGGTVSAPAVKDILADALEYLQVPPQLVADADKKPPATGGTAVRTTH